ncbi:phosphoserine phosphatase [Campylobacter blaseri]|uniref:Phosphoserine phosphatase n=1 Tax=Campylobacter blaseri TaxID=2042961 RepID=A0A2P8R154_9BACT|nr:phosphoserine phosphatase SerB [Campylobacter blaseri]PSM52226.1 phosphoserine phosphatase SerB [Campylobacter blaseri]PSM53992.1 phosphoserine phosphatase SerB [Campylobacter blaseri]QKF85429.1 phosphoserine phosphatase [Campylobacter blaseri]
MIKLCIFDFDNTLMDGETITKFAEHMGVGKEVADITNQAMAGDLDFFESFSKRVALVKGMKEEDAKELAKNLPFIDGAKEIISYLKEKCIKVVVFSGGFHIGTDVAQEKLGFDASFANYFHTKNGITTGLAGGEMMFNESKGLMLKQLKGLLGLKKEEVMCVGDGANDISMFKEAGLNIAFCAHEVLKKEATYVIDKRDLREIKKYV